MAEHDDDVIIIIGTGGGRWDTSFFPSIRAVNPR
jgi:hypothetical protein